MGRLNFEQTDGHKRSDGSISPLLLFIASAITSMWMLEVIVFRGL